MDRKMTPEEEKEREWEGFWEKSLFETLEDDEILHRRLKEIVREAFFAGWEPGYYEGVARTLAVLQEREKERLTGTSNLLH